MFARIQQHRHNARNRARAWAPWRRLRPRPSRRLRLTTLFSERTVVLPLRLLILPGRRARPIITTAIAGSTKTMDHYFGELPDPALFLVKMS
jgi:hypothetical protein